MNWLEMVSYRRRLLDDYFGGHGGNMDAAIVGYRCEDITHRHLRVTEIITALYWRYAFGVKAIECPNCDKLTINAWQPQDVWECYPCCLADALAEARFNHGDGEGR